MNFLLDDRLAPITSEVGFLKLECDHAANAYAKWQSANLGSRGVQLCIERISANSLEQALRSLLPLTSVLSTRALFVPTKGKWTAFFENAFTGGDAMAPMSYLAKTLCCQGLRVVAVPDTATKTGDRGRYGATVLELYGPEEREFLNYVRSIAAVNDGGRWQFVAAGAVQEFEEPTLYKARAVRDRFTPEILARYLQALSIDAFNEAFYVPSDAVLVEKTGALPETLSEYSLESARAGF